MLYSKLFGKTVKTVSKDLSTPGNKFLYQGGFIRESVAGRYYFLPLGLKVRDKVVKVIEEEMNAVGAQKLITPVLHPIELWAETNRTATTGFELMKIKDRRDAFFVLGGTAEEMIVDLVRKFNISYRDLPFNVYQFSEKFRDEARARGGLLRVREFLMKDAYSFHADEKDFKREYQLMADTYSKIFKRLGLETQIVESDNGYMGGEYCHEFVVKNEFGESHYFSCNKCAYCAHAEIALSETESKPQDKKMKPLQDVEGKGMIGVEELVKFLKIPVHATTKTIIFETDKGVVAAMIRGDFEISTVKLKNYMACNYLEIATPETVKKVTGAEVGYAGPVGLAKEVTLVADFSTKGRMNFEAGANKTNYHSINVNFERDFPLPPFVDLREPKDGDICGRCGKGKLKGARGIEVGNIFQLGTHYSERMKGASYTDANGKEVPYYMGCYGIGIGRTLATIAELYHDERGLIWPAVVSPYQVHLLHLGKDEAVIKRAQKLYKDIQTWHLEVIYDDREASAGSKLADADLLGIPQRVLISEKSMAAGGVEFKARAAAKAEMIKFDDLKAKLTK